MKKLVIFLVIIGAIALGLMGVEFYSNAEGGTHLTGFKTMFTNIINQYARELNILKDKDNNFTGTDVRNGMTAVISIKHPDPRFEGQTKTKLDNQDAAKVVSKITNDEMTRFFDRNLETLKAIIGCAEKAAKIRKTEEKAKTNMLTKQKYSFDSNGKLANCISKDASKCEIFIVEGGVEFYSKKVLSESWEELPPIFVTSSEKKQGRDEVLDYIDSINQELKNG